MTVTVTEAETVGVPEAVEAKRQAILEAARTGDEDAVAALAADPFSYSFGGAVAGGPAAYWRGLEANGEQPLEALAAILEMPYTLSTGYYVWPFAYDKTIDQITDYERELLSALPPDAAAFIPEGGYLGWRVGIEPDGDWVFFVSGD
ncbi:MAG: hypothetical protein WD689_07925 [Gaiellaceae bacterium]